MKRFAFFLLPFFLILSCEVIEAPYFEESYINNLPADEKCLLEARQIDPFPEGTVFEKKVLLEKMTGHQCGNCPPATQLAQELDRDYGDRVVFVAIHAGPLSNFNTSSSKYFSNFRTEAGSEWYTELNNRNAVPFGMIDRKLVGTNPNEWESFVQDRLNEPVVAGMRIFTCYEPDSLDLGVVVDIQFVEGVSENERLSVVLIENDIQSWQKDYSVPRGSSPDLENYVHQNALRSTVNGTWGEPLSTEAIVAGSRFNKSYSLNLREEWKAKNCRVVAFVYDFVTKEVHQVEEMGLVQ